MTAIFEILGGSTNNGKEPVHTLFPSESNVPNVFFKGVFSVLTMLTEVSAVSEGEGVGAHLPNDLVVLHFEISPPTFPFQIVSRQKICEN
jgi:hypothetical protein